MADLTITAANVRPVSASTATQWGTYGETVAQGQPVYLKAADSKWWLADADASVDTAEAVGVALTPGAADERGLIATAGPVDVGATLTVGEIYVVSGNAGGIAPEADLASLDWVTILGVATAADELTLAINASGVQVP